MVPRREFKESNGLFRVYYAETNLLDPWSVHAGIDSHYG